MTKNRVDTLKLVFNDDIVVSYDILRSTFRSSKAELEVEEMFIMEVKAFLDRIQNDQSGA
jgi:hypothetical protein